ncbi:NAD-dependent epimerase/dehydratase family protein [Nonomuraea dietziae]|uniref:NAD-dependent epimerase/dehydratase family protein n=1 Tax=Nonomuraea dietziae TaxID=65515 RepID=UPI0033D03066
MNVLIIGATGYIGGAIATAAQRAGHEVAGLRHPGGHTLPEGVKAVDGDLTDAASLTIAAKGFDRVVHVGPPLGEETDLAPSAWTNSRRPSAKAVPPPGLWRRRAPR